MRRADLGLTERLVTATADSISGLRAAWQSQQALRYEAYVLLVAIPLACWLGKNGIERVLLIASSLLVVVVELLNSAIETAVDRIGDDYHELSGRAKDFGSAAVFCSIILAVVVWLIILAHQ